MTKFVFPLSLNCKITYIWIKRTPNEALTQEEPLGFCKIFKTYINPFLFTPTDSVLKFMALRVFLKTEKKQLPVSWRTKSHHGLFLDVT